MRRSKRREWKAGFPSAKRRRDLDRTLLERDHVWATAFGDKIVGGESTGELAYTVFVDTKVAASKLGSHVVPPRVNRGGRSFPTDVVELKPLVFHSATAIHDGTNQGSLACFARSSSSVFGLSCAHALWGTDKSFLTPDRIRMYVPQIGAWPEVGITSKFAYEMGQGTAADFGILDAGIFTIDNAAISSVAAAGQPIPIVDGPGAALGLVGRQVAAEGAVSGLCRGVVRYVNWLAGEERLRVDVAIESLSGAGMTRQGDSGMLWKTLDGAAVAVHVLGEVSQPGGASRYSFGTFASRIARRLGVVFLSGAS